MANDTVISSRIIDAPIERVWRAWTAPEDIAQWFVAKHGKKTEVIQMNVRPGGKTRLKFPGAAGEYTWTYVEIDKLTKMVIDILDFSLAEYPEGNGGICNIELEDLNGKTRVTISGKLSKESMREMAEKGRSFTLNNLNKYLK